MKSHHWMRNPAIVLLHMLREVQALLAQPLVRVHPAAQHSKDLKCVYAVQKVLRSSVRIWNSDDAKQQV
jgi:hypothetical protein